MKKVCLGSLLMLRACDAGVTEWSFDGLEGLDASPKGWRGSDEEETEGSEQLPDFLGFSFRNLSQLKDMNLKELQDMENERLANMEQEGLTFGSSLPTTPGGSKLRSTMQ